MKNRFQHPKEYRTKQEQNERWAKIFMAVICIILFIVVYFGMAALLGLLMFGIILI